jgi:D-sedoheptulose 7-phosphate isomerase
LRKAAGLFAMGNGGSLCDALHIAVEFNHPIIEKRLAFPAIPLMTDIATMTAISNDLEFHPRLCESTAIAGYA